jgi:hypothetical protein
MRPFIYKTSLLDFGLSGLGEPDNYTKNLVLVKGTFSRPTALPFFTHVTQNLVQVYTN